MRRKVLRLLEDHHRYLIIIIALYKTTVKFQLLEIQASFANIKEMTELVVNLSLIIIIQTKTIIHKKLKLSNSLNYRLHE